MDSKTWWQSKAVWGGAIAVIAPVIGAIFHFNITAADQAAVADGVAAIATAVGGLLAIYGRVTATTKIGGKP